MRVMSRYVTRWPGWPRNVTSPASNSPLRPSPGRNILKNIQHLKLGSMIQWVLDEGPTQLLSESHVIHTFLPTDVRISPPAQVGQSAKHLDREVWIPLGAGTGRILTNSLECNSSQQFSATHWASMSHNVLMNRQASEISIVKVWQDLENS